MSPIISGGSGSSLSGVTVSGTAASGQVPVASSSSAGSWKYPPGFEISYTQITANVTITSTTEATGTTLISPGAITFDGTAVYCELFGHLSSDAQAAGDNTVVSLFEGATQITELAWFRPEVALTAVIPIFARYKFTPTAASHTYTITGFTTNSTGSNAKLQAGAGGTGSVPPAYVRFVKA